MEEGRIEADEEKKAVLSTEKLPLAKKLRGRLIRSEGLNREVAYKLLRPMLKQKANLIVNLVG